MAYRYIDTQPSNGWVFVYELSGYGFESSFSHLWDNFWILQLFWKKTSKNYQKEVKNLLDVGYNKRDNKISLIMRWRLKLTGNEIIKVIKFLENRKFLLKETTKTAKTKFRRISTLFPRTFFDVISMVEKSIVFLLTFCDVILMVEKSTSF